METITVNITEVSTLVTIAVTEILPKKIMRQDCVDAFVYIGKAEHGTADDAPLWTIYRLLVNLNGTVTKTSAGAVKWTDRLTTIYS